MRSDMGTRTHDVMKGRAKYVLILIVLLNMLYPITSSGSTISLIAFAGLYAGLFIVDIFITSDSRAQITWSISIAVIWLVMTVIGLLIQPVSGKSRSLHLF